MFCNFFDCLRIPVTYWLQLDVQEGRAGSVHETAIPSLTQKHWCSRSCVFPGLSVACAVAHGQAWPAHFPFPSPISTCSLGKLWTVWVTLQVYNMTSQKYTQPSPCTCVAALLLSHTGCLPVTAQIVTVMLDVSSACLHCCHGQFLEWTEKWSSRNM